MQTRSLLAVGFAAFAIAACSKSSDSAAPAASASAAPVWPTLPADPVDAMAAADDDPIILAYARTAGNTLSLKFRECINRELEKNPKLAGSVTMVANVNSDGTVASVTPLDLQGYNPESMKCLTKAISSAHFPAPPADHTIIKLPFTLKSG